MRSTTALGALVMIVASARADDARPWESGSTPSQREQAHKTFSTGNDHFFRRDYARALTLYESALAVFDHPRIRLATAEVLVLLGRPADAHVHAEAALRWGAAPFDADEFARAQELHRMLAKQLGTVVVRCTTDGARVTLDGQELLACPGEARKIVAPGRHEVVGTKDKHLPLTKSVVIEPARESVLDVSLEPLKEAAAAASFERRRRWASWKPWTFVAAGGGMALIGGAFQWRASTNMSAFRAAVEECGAPGCPAGHAVFDLESRAKLQNGVAVSLWVVGGAVATAGLVGVYLNREKLVPVERRVVITPSLFPRGVGLVLAGEL